MMTPKKRQKITILIQSPLQTKGQRMQLNGQMEGLGKKLENFLRFEIKLKLTSFQFELN